MNSFTAKQLDGDEDFDSEDLDDEQLNEMKEFSAAANIKFQGIVSDLKRNQSTMPAQMEDAKHTETFNQELAHLKAFLHDPTYD